MIRTSLAVIGAAVGLMVVTALIAGHSGPPERALSNTDADIAGQRLPPFVIKPQPLKINGLVPHKIVDSKASTKVDQTATAANPPAGAAQPAAPVAPTATDTATTKAEPEVAPSEPPPLLSTDLTVDHTKNKGGFLNFLRSVIRAVVGFLANASDNLWVIMFGVAGILFLTTGFWQFHAISEERHNQKEAGSSYGSYKTKGPCH
ncbi:unnamed protein product [Sphagnum balticum]